MEQVWPFLGGSLFALIVMAALGFRSRRAQLRTAEKQLVDTRLCHITGGHHDWGQWEDYGTDPNMHGLIQVRKCSQCGLGNQVTMAPMMIMVEKTDTKSSR